MSELDALYALAARQHGAFARRQATALGIDRARLWRAVRRGAFLQVAPDVFIVAGSPPTDRQRVMTAVLDSPPGTVVSHDTAAALLQLPGYELFPVHLLRPRGLTSHRTKLGRVHTTRRLPAHHTTTIDGIPVTTPTRVLFDLSKFVHRAKLERTIDNAWSARLTNGPLLYQALEDLARRGRAKVATMRKLLDVRGVDYVPPESGLEARFEAILLDAGLEPMDRQVDVGNATSWLARVDFRDRHLPLVVQVHSDRHHTALLDRAKDEAQRLALVEAGLVVVEVREFDVWHRRQDVIKQVRAGRVEARRLRQARAA
jgi:hypothetical protein